MGCNARSFYSLFALLILLLASSQPIHAASNRPEGALDRDELSSLIFGNTAEVRFDKSQRGLRYFSPNGELKQVKNDRLQKGHWKVKSDGRLCTRLGEGSWRCRVLVRKGESYHQYVLKKSGKHKRELTYRRFHSGRKLKGLSSVPILPAGTLSREELLALFSDKTVESVTAQKKRVSRSYYAPSGSLVQLRNGVERRGKWWVRKDDRICLQMEALKKKCRIIVREKGDYKKYIVKKNGRHQHSVSYRKFSPGNRL